MLLQRAYERKQRTTYAHILFRVHAITSKLSMIHDICGCCCMGDIFFSFLNRVQGIAENSNNFFLFAIVMLNNHSLKIKKKIKRKKCTKHFIIRLNTARCSPTFLYWCCCYRCRCFFYSPLLSFSFSFSFGYLCIFILNESKCQSALIRKIETGMPDVYFNNKS